MKQYNTQSMNDNNQLLLKLYDNNDLVNEFTEHGILNT